MLLHHYEEKQDKKTLQNILKTYNKSHDNNRHTDIFAIKTFGVFSLSFLL